MKSRFFFNAVLISLAAAFVLPLFSCSDASNDVGSGMVSFYVDKALMQKAVELSDNISKDPTNDPQEEMWRKFRFEVALEGEYSETKTVYASFKEEPYTEDPTGAEPRQDGPRYNFDSFSIDFDVPVGKVVWAKIKIYEESEQGRDEPVNERREPLLYGKSQSLKVSSGTNPLSVGAYTYHAQVPYKFEFKFDQEVDLSTCDSIVVYAVDPASKFVAKLKAAKDDVDRYEACNDFDEKYREDSYLGEMYLYPDGLDYSVDGKTVTAEGDMWMYVSEDDPASRAATALFVLMCKNFSGDACKTKYYGMASSAMTPMKKQTNVASISAQKLNVIDTQYALYNLKAAGDNAGYNYYLADSPSADVSGSPDYSSSGTSGSVGTYEQSFCYDADGNFYTMSILPDGGYDNYIYSTNTKIGEGGYHFEVPYKSFACDLKRNELFLYDGDLYATGDFIKTGAFDQTRYNLIAGAFPDANINENFAIYDGVAYFALTGTGYRIAKADLSKATADGVVLEQVAEIPVEEYVYPQISDMIAVDGAVYVIMRDITAGQEDGALGCYWDGTSLPSSSVTSRGCVVKCDPAKGTCEKLGWNGNTTSKDTLKDQAKMYFARLRNTGGDCKTDDNNIYYDNQGSGLFLVDGTKRAIQGGTDYMYTFFPDLQAGFGSNKEEMESNLSSCFASPAKFIAIKPKKLVISDDGLAFYTDTLGGLSYKNVDRVVTIDLEKFAIESVTATSAPFERQLSGWFSADIEDYQNNSLDSIVSGGTFYAASEIYYRSSSPDPATYNPAANTSTRRQAIFLAIKNGDEE